LCNLPGTFQASYRKNRLPHREVKFAGISTRSTSHAGVSRLKIPKQDGVYRKWLSVRETGILYAISAIMILCAGCSSQPSKTTVVDGDEIKLSTASLVSAFDVGQISNRYKIINLSFYNDTRFPVDIISVSNSCECYSVKMNRAALHPNAVNKGKVIFDLSNEAGFKGILSFETKMLLKIGGINKTLTLQIDAEVK
jgi:hypothetical protein